MSELVRRIGWMSFLVLLCVSCGPTGNEPSNFILPQASITGWGPTTVLPNSVIRIVGNGFLAPTTGTNTIWLRGNAGSQAVNILLEGTYISDTEIEVFLGPALTEQMVTDGPVLEGLLRITRTIAQNGSSSWQEIAVTVRLVSNLNPTLGAIPTTPWYPGDIITLTGTDFLLPGEGVTEILLNGSFSVETPPTTITIDHIIPTTAVSRNSLSFTLTPGLLGIKPGILSGSMRVRNTSKNGDIRLNDNANPVYVPLERPYIEAVSPAAASRGQLIRFHGRGFLPTSSDFSATSLIQLDGTFDTGSGDSISMSDEHALTLFPDSFQDNLEMEYVLRVYLNIDGVLEGLGTTAGVFTGQVRPWILHGKDTVLGLGVPITFTVQPPRQVVFIKFLPGYFNALDTFGLLSVENYVRTRLFEVFERDYAGINITFTDVRPEDFVEYSVVEVGGVDPNDANLFGLDNTQGKDVGNIRFNDIIGGVNAETEEEGYFAYGGIFVQSFLALSPTLGIGDLSITDSRFDNVFGPLISGLGGTPVQPGEYPGGNRSLQIAEAIRVLGNLVGNTITHEVGHSLGLANIEGQFHNIGDIPAAIMDAGIHRPFGERAEIDGEGPAVFAPLNHHYLKIILPTE